MNIIDSTFRYQLTSYVQAPLHVRSCGFYRLSDPEWHDRILRKNFLELFWGIRGCTRLQHDRERFLLQPETVFFYLPGDRHNISLLESPAEYCWITFDGNDLDNLIRSFGIKREVRFAGPCPTELFQSVKIHLHNYSQQGEYLAGAEGYKILSMAFASPEPENSLTERFRALVDEKISDNTLTPAHLAAVLGIHATTLTRNISKVTGMTPLDYIIARRLHKAMTLLRTTTGSIKEIACDTGFSDANYFAKVFRRKLGCSPSEFRLGSDTGNDFGNLTQQ